MSVYVPYLPASVKGGKLHIKCGNVTSTGSWPKSPSSKPTSDNVDFNAIEGKEGSRASQTSPSPASSSTRSNALSDKASQTDSEEFDRASEEHEDVESTRNNQDTVSQSSSEQPGLTGVTSNEASNPSLSSAPTPPPRESVDDPFSANQDPDSRIPGSGVSSSGSSPGSSGSSTSSRPTEAVGPIASPSPEWSLNEWLNVQTSTVPSINLVGDGRPDSNANWMKDDLPKPQDFDLGFDVTNVDSKEEGLPNVFTSIDGNDNFEFNLIGTNKQTGTDNGNNQENHLLDASEEGVARQGDIRQNNRGASSETGQDDDAQDKHEQSQGGDKELFDREIFIIDSNKDNDNGETLVKFTDMEIIENIQVNVTNSTILPSPGNCIHLTYIYYSFITTHL